MLSSAHGTQAATTRDERISILHRVRVTTGETEKIEPPQKNPHAQALAKLGAHKGGEARAKVLSAKRRKQIAKKAAQGSLGQVIYKCG